jgi:hypothetical protein
MEGEWRFPVAIAKYLLLLERGKDVEAGVDIDEKEFERSRGEKRKLLYFVGI